MKAETIVKLNLIASCIVGGAVTIFWSGLQAYILLRGGTLPSQLAWLAFFLLSGPVLVVSAICVYKRFPLSRFINVIGWSATAITIKPNYFIGVVAFVLSLLLLFNKSVNRRFRAGQLAQQGIQRDGLASGESTR